MALDFRKWGEEQTKRRRRRASTRWLLAAGLAILATLPIALLIAPGNDRGIFPNVMPFAILLIIASARSPFTRDTILTDRGLGVYDEFERTALMTATRRAYLTTILLLVAVFLWLAIGARAGWPLPTQPKQWSAIGFALLLAMLTLPATFAEFTVPMPDPEDDLL